MSCQDWNTVVAHKPKHLQADNKKNQNQQKQQQEQQKQQQQKNQPPPEVKRAKKVEDESEDFRHASIGRNFTVALQQARVKKGWKQEQLAQALNINKNIINQYESGKAIPDPSLISKMNRILGVTLPPVNKPKK